VNVQRQSYDFELNGYVSKTILEHIFDGWEDLHHITRVSFNHFF